MIKLINISKSYNKRILFKDVNLNISGPGIYSFIGDNGCGKTTLLNIIAKFIKPTSGKVFNKHKTAFISQKTNLIWHLTIKEHFEMFQVDIKQLRKVKLYSKLDCYPQELSEGQKQRIMAILTMYSSASIIIADEPTSHLDKNSSELIMKELVKVSKDKIVLLVSHDKKLIKKYSDVIYKIENNKVEILNCKEINKNIVESKHKKIFLKKYIKKEMRFYKRVNLLFYIILFISFFFIMIASNFKTSIAEVVNSNINNSLDYNKFYLKECRKVEKEIVIKECFNLSEDKVNVLKQSNHKLGFNYDLFLNSIYNSNKFNVVNKSDYTLKDGRYPLKYNEIITYDNHNIGDIISLSSLQVLTLDKTDIYKSAISLEVVGIIDKPILLNNECYYLDYDLVEQEFKSKVLINNSKTLFEYFEESEFSDYKYVLYFNGVDSEFLIDNGIDYLSASYDYYNSIIKAVDEINICLIYLNIIAVLFSFYYIIKLIKRKMNFKENEINFLKAMGINKKRIIKALSKMQSRIILRSLICAMIVQIIVFYLIFKEVFFNANIVFITYLVALFISKKIMVHSVKQRKIV